MMTIEQKAMERVVKARMRISLERPFYSVLIQHIDPVISRLFPTAATNGKQHFWNPDFVATLTDAELEGVQAHESEHDARHHGTRRGSRDAIAWNESADYSINLDLVAEGFTLPAGALIDQKYAGMASEDIYRCRELDRQQPEPEQPDEPKGEEGDEGDDEQAGDQPNDGDEQGDEPGEGAGEGAGEAGDETEGEGSGDAGDATGEPGEGSGHGVASPGGDSRGKPGQGEAEGEGGAAQAASSDPGRCGQVLDTVAEGEGNGNETAQADIDWEKIVRQAASFARGRGKLPGHISREIEKANNPPRDWRDELREFAEQGALRIETWSRPNRRFAGRGLVLPSTVRDGVNKAVFVIDTSGSMDTIALAAINNEAQALLDDGVVDQVVVVYGDTQVNRVDEYVSGDPMVFDPRGGGGTVLQPLFDHVAEEHDDASLIVCFTDGYTDLNNDSPEPACPVLFAFTGYPDAVRDHIANAPWGARGIDVGSH